MNKKYKHVFFDLDHTLWDFDKNSSETLSELFDYYGLQQKLHCNLDDFLNQYAEINLQLWHLYDLGKISKQDLRLKRFHQLFQLNKYYNNALATTIDEKYIQICPEKSHLIDGAIEILNDLKDKYTLHIITNGFEETQYRKLKSSKLITYFDTITTSENAQASKPQRSIFNYALKKASANYKESIMIGDNLKTDIQGSKNIGMDQVYFNAKKRVHNHKSTYEIFHLSELKNIL